MKITDLKIGEHYAAGSTSKYDRWRLNRVELISVKPLRVRLVEHHNPYMDFYDRHVGEEFAHPSARHLIEPWASYAEAKAAHEAAVKAAEVARKERSEILRECVQRLERLGFEAQPNFKGGLMMAPESMRRLLDLIDPKGPPHA